ncbi:MAG TPA: hypothetical protein VNK95_15310 [Caldilineaceae bacterium]|nr:hypothetical protein [Caldilineaceae bacterium]
MTTKSLVQHSGQPAAIRRRPYPPSWVNRLVAWVERLPGPPWPIYWSVALFLIALHMVINWADGIGAVSTFKPFHIVAAGGGVYYLALIHYLDRTATTVLDRFRPALELREGDYDEMRYRLTTLPAREARYTTYLGVAMGLVEMIAIAQGLFLPGLNAFISPAATAFVAAIGVFGTLMMVLFAYHTLHQLRVINQIFTRHTRIDLFALGPLYAFSHLTARTAVGWLLITYAWVATEPRVEGDLVALGNAVVVASLGLAAFVWPLLGIHRLLAAEKERAIAAVTYRLKLSYEGLNRRVDEGRFEETASLSEAANGLQGELAYLEKIPTWPWQPETVRGVLTAVVLPILLWLVTTLLERMVVF